MAVLPQGASAPVAWWVVALAVAAAGTVWALWCRHRPFPWSRPGVWSVALTLGGAAAGFFVTRAALHGEADGVLLGLALAGVLGLVVGRYWRRIVRDHVPDDARALDDDAPPP